MRKAIMLKVLQANGKSVGVQMREVMFGDLPWDVWCRRDGPSEEPWPLFRAAWTAKKNGDVRGSCACLEEIVITVDFEARQRVQAWHYLRDLGRGPAPEEAKDVLGIIVEKGLPEGTDVLGAYEDHTARYWSPGGTGILWNGTNESLDGDFEALFAVAQVAAKKIKPRKGAHPPPPALGMIQISLLTPSGIHMGKGTTAVLGRDRLAKGLVDRGIKLVETLMAQGGERDARGRRG
jgi:hypothetical protein